MSFSVGQISYPIEAYDYEDRFFQFMTNAIKFYAAIL